MPAGVTYWTGTWDPRQEAISKEVQALRTTDGALAPVVSFSTGQGSRLDLAGRVVTLGAAHWPVLRALAPAVERRGAVSHVFGALDSWHLLRAVGRRPTVLTVTIPSTGQPGPLGRVSLFAVESEALAAEARRAGITDDRIRTVYPGVDLGDYRPGPARTGRFRLLFASSPADPAEFDVRGIPHLVSLARACPDIDVVLLWREWGDQNAARQALEALDPTPNLRLEYRQGRSMPEVYRGADAVACLYADGFGKSCPNSVVEALACGVPALVSTGCGIAGLIGGAGAGLTVARRDEAIAEAVQTLREQRRGFANRARMLAERHFDIRTFVATYHALYRELQASTRAAAGSELALRAHS